MSARTVKYKPPSKIRFKARNGQTQISRTSPILPQIEKEPRIKTLIKYEYAKPYLPSPYIRITPLKSPQDWKISPKIISQSNLEEDSVLTLTEMVEVALHEISKTQVEISGLKSRADDLAWSLSSFAPVALKLEKSSSKTTPTSPLAVKTRVLLHELLIELRQVQNSSIIIRDLLNPRRKNFIYHAEESIHHMRTLGLIASAEKPEEMTRILSDYKGRIKRAESKERNRESVPPNWNDLILIREPGTGLQYDIPAAKDVERSEADPESSNQISNELEHHSDLSEPRKNTNPDEPVLWRAIEDITRTKGSLDGLFGSRMPVEWPLEDLLPDEKQPQTIQPEQNSHPLEELPQEKYKLKLFD